MVTALWFGFIAGIIIFVWVLVFRQIIRQKKVLHITLVLPQHRQAAFYTIYGLKYQTVYHKSLAGSVSSASVYHTESEVYEKKVKIGKTDPDGRFRDSFYLSNFYAFIFVSPDGKETMRRADSILQPDHEPSKPVIVFIDH